MKTLTQEEGVLVDDELKTYINKGISLAGNWLAFAKLANVPYQSLKRWFDEDNNNPILPWDALRNIRIFLEQNGILERDNFKWLIPSEMRMFLLERYKKQDAASMSVNETRLLNELRHLPADTERIVLERQADDTFNISDRDTRLVTSVRKIGDENRQLVEKLVSALLEKQTEHAEQSVSDMMKDGQN